MNSIYSETQLKEIDIFLKLLSKSESGILSLQSITEQKQYRNLNFSLFTEINKTYNLFTITNPFGSPHFSITLEGRKAAKEGFETYTKNLKNEKDKPLKYSKYAIVISIVLPILIMVSQIWYDNTINNTHQGNSTTNTNSDTTIKTTSFPNRSFTANSDIISSISDSLINDTTFIKKVSEKIKK